VGPAAATSSGSLRKQVGVYERAGTEGPEVGEVVRVVEVVPERELSGVGGGRARAGGGTERRRAQPAAVRKLRRVSVIEDPSGSSPFP
jgi:hypothetical protein